MKSATSKKLTVELSKDQILYLFQILQQERIKIESLSTTQHSPEVSRYQNLLNSLIHTIPRI